MKKWNLYCNKMTDMHGVLKFIVWIILTILLYLLLGLTVGMGSGIEKVLFWRNTNMKIFMIVSNEIAYIIIFAIIYVAFCLMNSRIKSKIFVFVQLAIIWINIKGIQYEFDGILSLLKECKSIWEHIMWVIMLGNTFVLMFLCIKKVRKSNR